jgi:hypothetical protein
MTTVSAPSTSSALSGTYALDTTHTRIGFVARHAMVTKVRGSFNEFEGTATLDFDDVSRSTALGHHLGREHRHPPGAARRAPAQQRLPGHGRAPHDHLRVDGRASTGDASSSSTATSPSAA